MKMLEKIDWRFLRSRLSKLTTKELQSLWRSEAFRALVREKQPYLYMAEMLFGEPDDIKRGSPDAERLIRFVIDGPPPVNPPEELMRAVDKLMKD
jgi:hypothetical protein